jgi:hypothetical protein
LRQRNLTALRLALEQSEQAVAEAIDKDGDAWVAELECESAQARERAADAVAAYERAASAMTAAAGGAAWIRSGQSDNRWDRRVPVMLVGNVAPSSSHRTANNEPLRTDELVGWLREALEPPPSPAPVALVGPVPTA